jgi:Xaa-Pro aminopeptidase
MDHVAYLDALRREPVPSEMAFPRDEYEARVGRLKALMGREGLDAVLVADPANMAYLAGYNAFSNALHGALLVPREGAPAMHVASIEVSVALLTTWIEDIVAYQFGAAGELAVQLAGLMEDRRLGRGRIGLDQQTKGLRLDVARGLEQALPNARFVDATPLMFELRRVKSPREIACHREAARITWAGIQAGLAAVAPGRTDNDVAAAAYDAMVRAGAEFLTIQPIVVSGRRVGWMHTHFRRVPLAVGDTVFLEFGGCYRRYTSPMMRTAVIGPPTDQVRRVAEAVKDTIARIMGAARPGRTCHEVAIEARKGLAPVAGEVFHTGTFAYAVGLQFPPSWNEGSTYIIEGNHLPLAAGMVFHLMLCYRVPGRSGVGLSETVLITDQGCESLTRPERDLTIVPA